MKQNYHQLIQEMNTLNIEKEKQIEFLLSRIESIELENKRKQLLERVLFLGTIFFLIGILFITLKIYFLGLVFIVLSFSVLSFKIITFARTNQANKYKKDVEKLSTLLNTKFK